MISSLLFRAGRVRGFTLIELLVVIAIIGILASVVLASLNTARDKGADAAIKGDLEGVRSQAETVYDSNGQSYAGVCADATVVQQGTAAAAVSGGSYVCNDSSTAWAIQAPFKSAGLGYWCVDSTGTAATSTTLLDAGVYVCP